MRAIAPQVEHMILIAHNFPIEPLDRLHVINYTKQPPNISEMWNLGLEKAQSLGADWTAVLNDDAIVFPHWFDRIETAIRKEKASGGWAAGEHSGHLLYERATATMQRMTGYAFVIRSNFRADEQFQWWYGDNDLEWRARENGGMVQVGGSIEHRHPNSTTVGRLAHIATEDGKRFKAKWGKMP